MDGGETIIAEGASRLAAALPPPVLRALADAVRTCDPSDWPNARSRLSLGIPHAHHRSLAAGFLDAWQAHARSLPAQAVALAMLTAAHVEKAGRERQDVELVWTGPETGEAPFRRTEPAILQVIEMATRRLLVVSYAVYNIPRICEALVRAAGRGVVLTLVVETGERQVGVEVYDTLRALGPAVASRSCVYLWPQEQRPRGQNGRTGILHVKCVAGDGRWLFVSSANLTEYAFTTNMELGVLITGGEQPARIEARFGRMISDGNLCRVGPSAGDGPSFDLKIQGEGPK